MPEPEHAYVVVKVPDSLVRAASDMKITLDEPTQIEAMASTWEALAWCFRSGYAEALDPGDWIHD